MKSVPVAVVALLLIAATGFAQDPNGEIPQAPASPAARNLVLDPASGAQGQGQGLVAYASVFESYDTYTTVGGDANTLFGTPLTTARLPSGAYTGLSGGLSYSYGRGGDRGSFGINGRSSVIYFPSNDTTVTWAGLSAGGSRRIASRTTIQATPFISYASYYDLGLFPTVEAGGFAGGFGGGMPAGGFGDSPGAGGFASGLSGTSPSLHSAAATIPLFQYGVSGGLDQQLGLHTNLALSYGLRRTDLRGRQTGLRDQNIGGRVSHVQSQHLTLNVGYFYRQGNYANNVKPFRAHDIDLGVNYHRALSFSRRTTFSFGSGSTLLTTDSIGGQTQPSRTDLRLLANANLDHYIGRTWSARLAYRRDWQFVEGFLEPFFVDGVTFGVGGSMGRRATLGASASYLSGQAGIGTLSNLQSYRSLAFFHVSLTPALSTYLQYQYYNAEFSDNVVVPAGYPTAFSRNSLQAGLVLVLPLIR